MNKNFSFGLFVMNLLFFISAVAVPAPQKGVAALMNQRLSYMKDVAGYKTSYHLCIEDLLQEARVLSASMAEADTLGLNGDSIKPFIQAQMDVAKAIQYRYHADWLSNSEQGWQPKPLEQVRSHIGTLSTAILQAISARLTKGQTFTDQQAFMHTLEQTNLNDGDKQRLWDSLTQVTLKITVRAAGQAFASASTSITGYSKSP